MHWKHEPIALEPSAKGRDAAGVWSGCSTLDEHGQPVILYTAVRQESARQRTDEHLPHNLLRGLASFAKTQKAFI